MKFIIEHMEDDLYEWNREEYAHVIEKLGSSNVVFTNLRGWVNDSLFVDCERYEDSVAKHKFCNIVLLDSESPTLLMPCDKFDYCLIGGILGDVGEFDLDRTKELRVLGHETRNLDKVQMSVDTAALVANEISKGTPFDQLNFVDNPSFEVKKNEYVTLNFRYLVLDDKIQIRNRIIELTKEDDEFAQLY